MAAVPSKDLEGINDPAKFAAQARLTLVPTTANTAPNVAVVERVCTEIPEMAQIATVGLFPGVDLLKGTNEELVQRRAAVEPYIAKLKERDKEAESGRLDEKRPVLEIGKNIDDRWKVVMRYHRGALAKLTEAWQQITGELKRREREAQRINEERAEAERKKLADAAAEAEQKGRSARAENLRERAAMVAAPPVEMVTSQRSEHVNTREEWHYKVLDQSKLNPLFLIPDDTKIGKQVRALKSDAVAMLGGPEAIKVWSEDVPIKKR